MTGVQTCALPIFRVRGCGPAYVKLGRMVRYRLNDLESYISKRVIDPDHKEVIDETGKGAQSA